MADGDDPPLIPPDLLAAIPDAERPAALAAARAARRAEERAEERALQRAMERRMAEREKEREKERKPAPAPGPAPAPAGPGLGRKRALGHPPSAAGDGGGGGAAPVLVFVSKKRREELKRAQRDGTGKGGGRSSVLEDRMIRGRAPGAGGGRNGLAAATSSASARGAASAARPASHLTAAQVAAIKRSYLGEAALTDEQERRRADAERRERREKSRRKTSKFKFEWGADEDTATDELEALYGTGAGAGAGSRGRGGGGARRGAAGSSSVLQRRAHDPLRADDVSSVHTVGTKPLAKMTSRDWRILRENYNITVKGGRAPAPLRSFREAPLGIDPLHPSLLHAIEKTLKYKEPSPIQRQAIPIGLQRRDLIGIAETGSGKTAAFGIPLLQYILSLPQSVLNSVAESGPLALVMAPTRELALQISEEFAKLLSGQRVLQTLAVVGGQPIQQQASKLREGVHAVVGTPGRLNDCLEMAYLVLNQCAYVVLDEADRMIDLGFAPQIESILDAMGGALKSQDEAVAYRQEEEDLARLGRAKVEGGQGAGNGTSEGAVPSHRLTAMFSATMPAEVERIAKRYLRHPAVVSIGDRRDSGKNARIVQRVLFLPSASQKEKELKRVLSGCRGNDKIIIFVNEKRHTENVGRIVERHGRRCVVLHGGKTQEQREENLGAFRRGGVVLVATDVAGRGLDIPDVAHVINYDVPSRSIENYCHRIGRTGRAGKEGVATSFITDADEGIMAHLKAYLESTGQQVPDRLARHRAASARGAFGDNIRL